jgi:hypothetical protein
VRAWALLFLLHADAAPEAEGKPSMTTAAGRMTRVRLVAVFIGASGDEMSCCLV